MKLIIRSSLCQIFNKLQTHINRRKISMYGMKQSPCTFFLKKISFQCWYRRKISKFSWNTTLSFSHPSNSWSCTSCTKSHCAIKTITHTQHPKTKNRLLKRKAKKQTNRNGGRHLGEVRAHILFQQQRWSTCFHWDGSDITRVQLLASPIPFPQNCFEC